MVCVHVLFQRLCLNNSEYVKQKVHKQSIYIKLKHGRIGVKFYNSAVTGDVRLQELMKLVDKQ